MSLDYSNKTIGELENFVKNYREKGKTDSEAFIVMLRELELRRGKGLDLQKTLDHVIKAAQSHRYVAYKEIAEINGLPWTEIHWEIGDHLGKLCEYAHRKGMPLLSSIVVNQDGLANGQMKADSRKGFIDAAINLGFSIRDDEAFVMSEQEKVFAWAEKEPAT